MKFNLNYKLFIIIIAIAVFLPLFARAAEGVPNILNYQGRLYDANGDLLGGATGVDYCFKFSIYDDEAVGAPDNKIWPSIAPSGMNINVKEGVFNVGIGDTSAGGDELDFNFQDNDTIYLNVEAAVKIGASCTDGDEVFENLSPRQRIFASGYAINSDMLDGLHAESAGGMSQHVLATNQFGNMLLNGESRGTGALDSLLYFNPTSATSTYSLLGLAINSQEKFKIDASGSVFASGTIYTAQDVIVNGQSVCLEDGTNCPAIGGGGGWQKGIGHIYLETSTDNVTIGTSTLPLGKLNIYGDTDEIQLLVQAAPDQTANLTEWRNSAGNASTYIVPNGNIITSGTVYAEKFKHIKSQGGEGNVFEWEDENGDIVGWMDAQGNTGVSGTTKTSKLEIISHSPAIEVYNASGTLRAWIDGSGATGASGTIYAGGLEIDQSSPQDPLADEWVTYSTRDTKDIVGEINSSGYLERIVDEDTFEYRRKADIKKEYKEALEEKLEEEWQNALESGEEIIVKEDKWKKTKEDELEASGWSDEKRQELFNWKSALPKFTQSRLGVMADDITTPPEILAYNDDGEPIGINVSAYAGFLHVAIKEAGMRIIALEDSINYGNGGYISSSSAPFGDILGESLVINYSGLGDAINVQSASSTVFAIDADGNSLFGPATDSASAFLIKDAADMETLFTADTLNSRIKIGDNSEAGSPTTIFVLDTKADAGDPLGEDGSMYYSANTKKFRCYEGGEWKDCISEGGVASMMETYFTFFAVAEPVVF